MKGKSAFSIIFILLAVVLTPQIQAQSIDYECQSFGYDYAVSSWYWNEGWRNTYLLEGYNVNLQGDQTQIDWTANPEVTGIISKETCNYQVVEGGTEGTIKVYAESDLINNIVFCADEKVKEEPPVDVPEFGTIAAIIILISAGIVINKKRK